MKEQINEQLALLEKELSRLKKVTDYIDDTKKTAQSVITELKTVQDNYSTITQHIQARFLICINHQLSK